MYANNELFFPHHLIPVLADLRGDKWRALVEDVLARSEYHEESLAFMLVMIRLNGCLGCETDSYRAMRGCEMCAVQTLRRFKGSDDELIAMYEQAISDVRGFSLAPRAAQIMREPTPVRTPDQP